MADWSRAFDDPIPLPRGRKLITLKDAANYIQKPPKAEQDLEEWQSAVEALLLVVELSGPTMTARIARRGHKIARAKFCLRHADWSVVAVQDSLK